MPMAMPPAPANSSTLRIEKSPDDLFEAVGVIQLAFPDGQHLPALPRKRPFVSIVPFAVSFQLWSPEFEAGLGHARQGAACVPVPETTMDEDNLAPGPEHKIGTAGQFPCVEPIPIAETKDDFPDGELRTRVR